MIEEAAVLLIADEILSGSTQDKNLLVAAQVFASKGVKLAEARVIADDVPTIVETLNTVRQKYTYVVTSGGIGPTHDDMTIEAVAQAFGVPLVRHTEIEAKFRAKYSDAMTPAVLKMADYPVGAELFPQNASTAPGFQLGNVFVCAGIPTTFRAMLEAASHKIKQSDAIETFALHLHTRESIVAKGLADLQAQFKDVPLGSYPTYLPDGTTLVKLVARSQNPQRLAEVAQDLKKMAHDLGLTPVPQ